jgi:methionyl-tRNA formyltransferase
VEARALGLNLLSPQRAREAIPVLAPLGADLFVVAAYGRILPQAVLDLPRLGALNVHPSLLPLYRGASPLQAQIRDRCATTGVTVIAMDAGMDSGDIVLRESTRLEARETYGELEARLAEMGAALILRAVELARTGDLTRVPQAGLATPQEIEATLTRPLRREDLEIDWALSAARVDAFVRSLSPRPCARAQIAGTPCKIVAVHPQAAPEGLAPGTPVRIPRGLAVVCGEGAVAVDRLIPANRAAMSGEAFAASLFAGRKHLGR